MPILEANRYGKHRVRVLRVGRESELHEVCELEADVLLAGGLEASYVSPDNSSIMPTDTVKNTVHALAHDHLGTCRTTFARVLGAHFLERYAHLTGIFVELRERRWGRMAVKGELQPHAFVAEENGQWFARSEFHRDQPELLRAGLRDHLIMKTTGSGFEGYHLCDLTTLPPTRDRILATRLSAEWEFEVSVTDPAAVDAAFLKVAYEVFAQTYSPSVQRTLFEVGEAFLKAVSSVRRVELKLPNVHFLGLDLAKVGRPDQTRVFLPTDEPHGQIEAVVGR
jgi:urate oxidase